MRELIARRWVAILSTSIVASWILHLYLLLDALGRQDRPSKTYEFWVLGFHEALLLLLIWAVRRRRRQTG